MLRNESGSRYGDKSLLIKDVFQFQKSVIISAVSVDNDGDGLVKRVQYPEIPVRVEYSVTEECAELVPAFEIIGKWSREKLDSSEEISFE